MDETDGGVIIMYYVILPNPRIMPSGPYRDYEIALTIAEAGGGQVAMVTASPVTHGGKPKPRNGSDTPGGAACQ